MKKLKALSTAATLGLAALSLATAWAGVDLTWHPRTDAKLWSDANNWDNSDGEEPSSYIPRPENALCFQTGVDNRVILDCDAAGAGCILYGDAEIIGTNGCSLTVDASTGEQWSNFSNGAKLTLRGTNSVFTFKGVEKSTRKTYKIGGNLTVTDGATASFSAVTLVAGVKHIASSGGVIAFPSTTFLKKNQFEANGTDSAITFSGNTLAAESVIKATAGGKITLPSAAMAESMTFTADGKDSVVTYANSTPSSGTYKNVSVRKNTKVQAYNGGKVSLSSLLPQTSTGVSFDLRGGVLAVGGEVNLGNNDVAVTMNLAGAKPTGGFLQVSGSKGMSLGGYLTINMKPEDGWADGSSTGLIAYKGTSSATMWDDVHYVVDLSNFYGIEAGVTKTICVFSNTSSGKSYQPSDATVSFVNDTGVDAHFEVVGNAINLVVKRGHYWSDWTISKLPTRSANGQKCRRCTDDGCTAVQTKEIANSKLPGDFLHMDGKGYFETGYTPDVMKSHVELRVQLLSNQEVVNHSLFWPKSGGEWGLVWYEDDKGIQYYDEAEEFSLANPFSDVKKAHVFRAFGNTAQLDNNAVVVGTKEASFANCGYLLIGAHKPWNSTQINWFSTMKVYYFKIWENDESNPVHYYVPALNGNQATLFDLVTETYLTPKSGSGFTIGKDPGLMMFLR